MKLGNGKGFQTAMALSIPALVLGLGLGALAHGGYFPSGLTDVLGPIGNLWSHALQLSVLPLVVSLIVAGIGGLERRSHLGRWSLFSILAFAVFLFGGALFAVGVWSLYAPAFGPSALDVPTLAGASPFKSETLTFGAWIESLLPANLIQSAANGEMLPNTLSAILFALALRQLPAEARERVVDFFQAIRDVVLVYVGWILILMPLGAFALSFAFAAEAGLEAAGATLHFLLLSVGVLLGITLLTAALAAFLGRVPLLRFFRAALPAQTLAVGSRSSLACLPTLLRGAQDLDLPEPASDLVLPLAASVFKPNRTVTSVVKLLFLGALFGVALSPADVVSFVLTVLVLSISSPGLPSAGTRLTFGAYVAAGLPPAAVLFFDVMDPLIDVFKTLYNVTANLAVAAIVSRFAAGTRAEAPTAAADPA